MFLPNVSPSSVRSITHLESPCISILHVFSVPLHDTISCRDEHMSLDNCPDSAPSGPISLIVAPPVCHHITYHSVHLCVLVCDSSPSPVFVSLCHAPSSIFVILCGFLVPVFWTFLCILAYVVCCSLLRLCDSVRFPCACILVPSLYLCLSPLIVLFPLWCPTVGVCVWCTSSLPSPSWFCSFSFLVLSHVVSRDLVIHLSLRYCFVSPLYIMLCPPLPLYFLSSSWCVPYLLYLSECLKLCTVAVLVFDPCVSCPSPPLSVLCIVSLVYYYHLS